MHQVVFQYFDDCPNWHTTHDRLVESLGGRDEVQLVMCSVETLVEAEQVSFLGSPSITIDNVDLFGHVGAVEPGSLACRLYPTADGSPTLDQIDTALDLALVKDGRR